jgi:hypothetical protein
MRRADLQGRLFINEREVGQVWVRGWEGAWGLGDFRPLPQFAPFAPQFEEWSRLMHSPATSRRLSRDVAEQLRKVECALYVLRARLFVVELGQWREISILNIDGPLIEWKERWVAEAARSRATSERHVSSERCVG